MSVSDRPTNERLDEIRARVNKATEGPWRVQSSQDLDDGPCVVGGAGPLNAEFVCETASDRAGLGAGDAEFIAHAREDVPWLLAERDTLADALRDADGALLLVMDCEEGTVSPEAVDAVNAAHERIAILAEVSHG